MNTVSLPSSPRMSHDRSKAIVRLIWSSSWNVQDISHRTTNLTQTQEESARLTYDPVFSIMLKYQSQIFCTFFIDSGSGSGVYLGSIGFGMMTATAMTRGRSGTTIGRRDYIRDMTARGGMPLSKIVVAERIGPATGALLSCM